MSTLELNLFTMLKSDLNLSDERAKKYVEIFKELQEVKIKELSNEYRSIFKEDFNKIESNIKAEIKADTISLRNEMNNTTRWMVGIIFAVAMMIVGLYLKG